MAAQVSDTAATAAGAASPASPQTASITDLAASLQELVREGERRAGRLDELARAARHELLAIQDLSARLNSVVRGAVERTARSASLTGAVAAAAGNRGTSSASASLRRAAAAVGGGDPTPTLAAPRSGGGRQTSGGVAYFVELQRGSVNDIVNRFESRVERSAARAAASSPPPLKLRLQASPTPAANAAAMQAVARRDGRPRLAEAVNRLERCVVDYALLLDALKARAASMRHGSRSPLQSARRSDSLASSPSWSCDLISDQEEYHVATAESAAAASASGSDEGCARHASPARSDGGQARSTAENEPVVLVTLERTPSEPKVKQLKYLENKGLIEMRPDRAIATALSGSVASRAPSPLLRGSGIEVVEATTSDCSKSVLTKTSKTAVIKMAIESACTVVATPSNTFASCEDATQAKNKLPATPGGHSLEEHEKKRENGAVANSNELANSATAVGSVFGEQTFLTDVNRMPAAETIAYQRLTMDGGATPAVSVPLTPAEAVSPLEPMAAAYSGTAMQPIDGQDTSCCAS